MVIYPNVRLFKDQRQLQDSLDVLFWVDRYWSFLALTSFAHTEFHHPIFQLLWWTRVTKLLSRFVTHVVDFWVIAPFLKISFKNWIG